MRKRDDEMDEMLRGLQKGYNRPPDTPREEMWSAIEARIKAIPAPASKDGLEGESEGVLSLGRARRTRMAKIHRPLGWAVAAAALLVLGLGIGRMTAPGARSDGDGSVATTNADPEILRAAAVDHLARTEALLTLVRADARAGTVEPGVGSWARGLLSQTRLLMDAQGESDPAMARLLEDLELVLVQIVGVANADGDNQDRVRSELNLALDGIDEREILPRIQAVVPAGPRYAGT